MVIIFLAMKSLLVKSYAKINICLGIEGKREDGYHNLDMVMLPLELHDSILISKLYAPDNFVTIDDFSNGLLNDDNVVSRAIEKLSDRIDSMTETMNSRSLNNYITVDGATDPNAFADGLIRSFKLNARTV